MVTDSPSQRHATRDIVCEAMYVVFHSNFAAYIVCRRYKPCEFLDLFGPIARATNPIMA